MAWAGTRRARYVARVGEWGCFPFGRPNTVRPARVAARPEVVVIGVYPSAWHVAWRAPEERRSRAPASGPAPRSGAVAALAVDVEPTVFWDGDADDFGERLLHWKEQVGFVEGRHGSISPKSPSTNGSSGEKVVKNYLSPLGIDALRATFTDVYPVFLIKSSAAARREQGNAIRDEYDSIAERMGTPRCSLPPRIASHRLPLLAASTFGHRLVADLSAAAAPLVITLGREVWDTLLAISALNARPPRDRFEDLYTAYGSVGSLTVDGREVVWLPLVHPGLLKGKADPDADVPSGKRTGGGWMTLHARWAAQRTNERSSLRAPHGKPAEP